MKYAGYGLAIVGMLIGLYMTITGYWPFIGQDPLREHLVVGVFVMFGSLLVFVFTRVIASQRG